MSDLKEVKNGYRPIIGDQQIATLFNPAGLPMSAHAAAERLNQFVAKVAELEEKAAMLDWMLPRAANAYASMDGGYSVTFFDSNGDVRGKYYPDADTPEEAIRQAMKEVIR